MQRPLEAIAHSQNHNPSFCPLGLDAASSEFATRKRDIYVTTKALYSRDSWAYKRVRSYRPHRQRERTADDEDGSNTSGEDDYTRRNSLEPEQVAPEQRVGASMWGGSTHREACFAEMAAHTLEWRLPALQATVVRLRPPPGSPTRPATAVGFASAMRASGVAVGLRQLAQPDPDAPPLFAVWGRSPLDEGLLYKASAEVCAIGRPKDALIELCVRTEVDQCLADLGLHRVGEQFYLNCEQLCAQSDNLPCRWLEPTRALHCSVAVCGVGADGVGGADAGVRVRVEFEQRVVRLRRQQRDSPLALRTLLLPRMRRELDETGSIDLMRYTDDYEAENDRAVALLAPSLTRVTILFLATERTAVDAFVSTELNREGETCYRLVPADSDSHLCHEQLRAPAGRLPLEDVALWALVQMLDGPGEADPNSRAVDVGALVSALLERHDGAQQPPVFNLPTPDRAASSFSACVLVVNAVHLLDAVGVVPSTVGMGETIDGRAAAVGAADACKHLCALIEDEDASALGLLRNRAGGKAAEQVSMRRRSSAARARREEDTPPHIEAVEERELCFHDLDEQDWEIMRAAREQQEQKADAEIASSSHAAGPTSRFVTGTAAQLLYGESISTAGFDGSKEGSPSPFPRGVAPRTRVLVLEDVLRADGKLSAVGIAVVDAAFDKCDRDADGATGGDTLEDEDMAFFCAQFESTVAPAGGQGLTRAGFRMYFSSAFAEDAPTALADLEAF
ncbi:hypothetical protein T492DRAFT_864812 [Pavlovales sp. CCMP2436]|nr:hypothetical protein T492DRAFT_864812 [Pavlovales sp. CCMP2436]